MLNKYFPPDFDPSKMPRAKKVRSEDKQMKASAGAVGWLDVEGGGAVKLQRWWAEVGCTAVAG